MSLVRPVGFFIRQVDTRILVPERDPRHDLRTLLAKPHPLRRNAWTALHQYNEGGADAAEYRA
jgi:hypothetical protein